ncbi:hypothetical protein LOTGIDRAFT_109602 [Lottia gigantea]|uniref:Uncharacterized protein n=1 Tax=Lottia gigantea TaxID=225164 RepID=V4ALI0_LOTGI|nr:hypothetical protein LOTGIDRAFT_109602 [Lottia gigantea]ESP05039.1 hypothetical protein LOTGIDRAFT_109602 [Lottia gigantea]
MGELGWADVGIVIGYFTLLSVLAFWASCRGKANGVKDYFLAGRNMLWVQIGASLFATNFGLNFFIGMSGSAAASGLGVTVYEWHAIFILILLGWFFVPVYVSSGAYTMPQYLKKRFGGKRLRTYLSLLSIFLLVVQRISVNMYSGALFVQQAMGWNMYISIISVTAFTTLFTILGGLSAIVWAHCFQIVAILICSTYLTVLAFIRVGGMEALFEKYMMSAANMTSCDPRMGLPREDSLHIFRDPVTSDVPWTGAVFGLTPMAILAFCTDQVMVQRVLAAKTHSHAKGGVIFAAWLKITPFFLVILPGMIGRVLFPDEIGCVEPELCMEVCENPHGCSNLVYPKLIVELLPNFVRGLMTAGMLSALMGTLTSIFNSASSMFTLDLWPRCRPKASERELMVVSKVFIVGLMCTSLLWMPILENNQGGQLWNYIQAMAAYIAPPFPVVFLLGVAWQRTTEQGAFWSLISGLLVGLTRLVLDISYQKPACGETDTRPTLLSSVHFLHFAAIITVISFVVCVVVSLCTQPRSEVQVSCLSLLTD